MHNANGGDGNKLTKKFCDNIAFLNFDVIITNLIVFLGITTDMRLGKDDLRFKLMRKNMLGQVRGDIQRNGVDLREMLSREAGPSTTSLRMRHRMPERADARHLEPERKDASIMSQYPSTRSADALFQMDSLRKSYSPWTLDQLRQRSPDRDLRTSRNLSPERRNEAVMRRPLLRTYDDARAVSYMSAGPYMTKPTIAAASGKPLVPLPAPPPQLSGVVHKSSYTVQITYLDCFFYLLHLQIQLCNCILLLT